MSTQSSQIDPPVPTQGDGTPDYSHIEINTEPDLPTPTEPENGSATEPESGGGYSG